MKKIHFSIIFIAASLFITGILLNFPFFLRSEDKKNDVEIQEELNETDENVIPGKSAFNSSVFRIPTNIELTTGETKEEVIILETKNDGPEKVTYTIVGLVDGEYSEKVIAWPEGLNIDIKPICFTAHPNKTYNSTLIIKTTPELKKGEYYIYITANFETVANVKSWFLIKVT